MAQRSLDEELLVVREQRETLERMDREAARRERTLAGRREAIDRALLRRRPLPAEALRVNDYLSPGETIPPGLYRVIHRGWCTLHGHTRFVGTPGEVVRECPVCGAGIRYRLLQRRG